MCTSGNPVNGLTLYHFHHSYYSQRVWLTLLEKNVPFSEVLINASQSHQYVPWFLALNPKGEVPVLCDNNKIIVNSQDIIDYIEDNFKSENHRRLTPLNLNYLSDVEDMRKKIDSVDANFYSVAVAFYPELADKKHYPFSLGFAQRNLREIGKLREVLIRAANEHPQYSEILLSKANSLKTYIKHVSDKVYAQLEMEPLIVLMEQLEKKLMFRPPECEDWWLCCDEYTLADVSLTVLLYRLWLIGLHPRTFGLLPHLDEYFSRARERPAFKSLTGSLIRKDIYLFASDNVKLLIIIGLFILAILIVIVGLCVWV